MIGNFGLKASWKQARYRRDYYFSHLRRYFMEILFLIIKLTNSKNTQRN
jgi:hypothetical protein